MGAPFSLQKHRQIHLHAQRTKNELKVAARIL